MTTPDEVCQALAGVIDPLLRQNLVDLGMVYRVRVARGGRVTVELALPSPHWPATAELALAVQAAAASQPGVSAVEVRAPDNAVWSPYRMAAALRAPVGLSAEEPPLAASLAPARGRVQRLQRRLLGR